MTQHAAVTLHAIRCRAYERWLERGSPAGSPEHDWHEAEQELLAAAARVPNGSPPLTATVTCAPPSGVPRRRAPRSIGTRATSAPAARLLAALVPEATAELERGTGTIGRGRR